MLIQECILDILGSPVALLMPSQLFLWKLTLSLCLNIFAVSLKYSCPVKLFS